MTTSDTVAGLSYKSKAGLVANSKYTINITL